MTLAITEPELRPQKMTGEKIVPPIIPLCLGLCLLTGGSYLDLSFGYEVPSNKLHKYFWQALNAIDCFTDPFFDNIKSSSIHAPSDELSVKNGFASLSNY